MHGGVVGSKSYLMVVEIHDAAVIWTLTSPVAASQLAAGAFVSAKMTAQDLTSPVAAIQLAASAALLLLSSLPQALFLMKMATQDLTSPVAARKLPADAFCQ